MVQKLYKMTNPLLKTYKELREEFEKKFRDKWGRFYFSETVEVDWEKPKDIHPELLSGIACVASDDIENDIKSFHKSSILSVIDAVEKWAREYYNISQGTNPFPTEGGSVISNLLHFLQEAREGISKE